MGAVAIGAIFFAILLVVAAAVAWERRSAERAESVVYLVDEAISFVHGGLPEPNSDRITPDDVRSMLEWSMYHSQVVVARRDASGPVLGGPEAVAFVHGQSQARGLEWAEEDVALVLDLEAAYLVSIGAVGEAVEEETP